MILPFSTQLNKKPTYFPEKILSGLLKEFDKKNQQFQSTPEFIYDYGNFVGYNSVDAILENVDKKVPKLHTIREDKNNRWRVGTKIDFFINARQKNMYRFAPVLPVVSIQKIQIIHAEFINDIIIIMIDNRKLNLSETQQLAWNDGFENLYEFILFFNKDFEGKIIHWTNYIY